MEKFRERFLRSTGRVTDIMPLALVIAFVLMAVGSLLSGVVLGLLGLNEETVSELPDDLATAYTYLTFTGIWVVLLGAMAIFKPNRPMLGELTTRADGNTVKNLLLGLLAGFGMNAICIAVSVALGDIRLSFSRFEPLPFLLIFLAVAVQSGAEEVVCRQYVYQKLRRRYKSPWFAIVVSAVFFSALHLANPGINVWGALNIVLIGVLLSVVVFRYHSLWASIAIHTAWNYTQNIIFGLPNSGLVSRFSIFKLEAASNGVCFDTGFGVEGSLGACVVILVVSAVLIVIAHRERLQPDDIWAPYETDEGGAHTGRHMAS